MAHTGPDWGINAPKLTTYSLQDMAELAARLGSIDTFDRRGEVMLLDNFEDNINKWDLIPEGTGSSIALSTDTARNGAKSAKLVAGSDGNKRAMIVRYMTDPVPGRLGAEISFTLENNLDYFELYLYRQSASGLYYAKIKYTVADGSLKYLDAANNWQALASALSLPIGPNTFHTAKLVISTITGEYARLLLDSTSYDLSSDSIYTTTPGGAPLLGVAATNYGKAGVNAAIYVDDFILTQNEP